MQNFFGIMIPGQLPITSFEFINNLYCVDLPNPGQIN